MNCVQRLLFICAQLRLCVITAAALTMLSGSIAAPESAIALFTELIQCMSWHHRGRQVRILAERLTRSLAA